MQTSSISAEPVAAIEATTLILSGAAHANFSASARGTASVREPCTAQQLACGLGWTLQQTVCALQRLEASLANTGQILTRLGHHSYTLGPRPRLVTDREIARCLRHSREPLDLTAAAVLHNAAAEATFRAPLIAAISADHIQPAPPGIVT
jgi:hypothetical protein